MWVTEQQNLEANDIKLLAIVTISSRIKHDTWLHRTILYLKGEKPMLGYWYLENASSSKTEKLKLKTESLNLKILC